MARSRVRVGLIGCGNISNIYLRNAPRFAAIELVACADLHPQRAHERAAEFGISTVCTPNDILSDPEIGIVLSLTVPRAHSGIALAAVRAGKSVYSEKPLALDRADAQRILDLARDKGLRIGCAPDTFLGAGLQTARRALDTGLIGQPLAATACMVNHGPEGWHPDPAFYYAPGGGPLFDMGPYYLTALVSLFGPVQRVCGVARIGTPQRVIQSEPKRGQTIEVQVPTHVVGILEFAAGLVATLVTSFEVWHATLPLLEVYGTAGSLSLPDPNTFGGPVRLRRAEDAEWTDVPLSADYADNCRGLGLADMAHAMQTGRPHRASGDLALHVLDIMQALLEAGQNGRYVELTTTCTQPAPLPSGLPAGVLDD